MRALCVAFPAFFAVVAVPQNGTEGRGRSNLNLGRCHVGSVCRLWSVVDVLSWFVETFTKECVNVETR